MDNLRNIFCERRVYTHVSYTHSHPYAQLLLPLEGSLFIKTRLHQVSIEQNHLFFLPPGDEHTFYSGERNEFLVLDIPSTFFPSQDFGHLTGGLYLELDQQWQALRTLFLYEIGKNSELSHSLNDLFRYASRLLIKPEELPASVTYIHNHFQESISLDKLAALEHYNTSYYCEWFQKKTGLSPMAYIQKLRLEKAKNLLLNTDLSLLQISHEVGYEQQSSLTRLFKHKESISPTDYRKKFRKYDKN
ncbi:MAG: helix-turn-helix domain-containing protein [Bacillota bacterium]